MKVNPHCDKCGARVDFNVDCRFASGYLNTVVIFDHPKRTTCLACGAELHLSVIGLPQVQVRTVPAPAQNPADRQLVVIPGVH